MIRKVGEESQKTYQDKLDNGFFKKYMNGNGLDIGFAGYIKGTFPILNTAIGVDTNYPGYDGETLPFESESQDYVYSSHCLEHIKNYRKALKEWFRVLKLNGHLIITVPHADLYEKKQYLPSRWNEDHKRFYSPTLLLLEIHNCLGIPNSWRLRYMQDNDKDYDYSIPPDKHAGGCYEIEIVIQKIRIPNWNIE